MDVPATAPAHERVPRSTALSDDTIGPDYVRALLCGGGAQRVRWRAYFYHLSGQASTSTPAVHDPSLPRRRGAVALLLGENDVVRAPETHAHRTSREE